MKTEEDSASEMPGLQQIKFYTGSDGGKNILKKLAN